VNRGFLFGVVAACGAFALSGCIPAGRVETRPQPERPLPPATLPGPASSLPGAAGKCVDQLWSTGSDFTVLEGVNSAPGCSVASPVRLVSFSGDQGTIGVTNLSVISCETANAMAGWVRYGVDRAARQILGAGVARVETFGAYNCRAVAGTTNLSAHGSGQAVDVSGFVLSDGRVISIKQAWHGGTAAEREFLRKVRQSACRRFGIVLSPDYDTAHQDHFHLETGSRMTCR